MIVDQIKNEGGWACVGEGDEVTGTVLWMLLRLLLFGGPFGRGMPC